MEVTLEVRQGSALPLLLVGGCLSPSAFTHQPILATCFTGPPCRQGAGIPLFGKSFTYSAARPHMRIDFQFDQAAFYFKRLPFTIPYPVPFKLLGDETKVRI